MFGHGLATGRLAHTELKDSVVQELLRCINLLPTSYKLYVDVDGHVVVIPAEQRAIDLTGVDKGLADCMLQVLGEMSVTAESSEFDDASQQSALATDSADFSFLLANGAKGQRTQSGFDASADALVSDTALVDRSEHQLTKRCVGYYGAYLDIHVGCHNSEYATPYFGGCQSYASSYASVQFYNPDVCNTMLTSI